MTDDLESLDLIDRMRRKDVTALAELYDRHGTAAFSLACRIVRNPAEAEDVVQEAFLQAWQQSGRFDLTRAAVQGWLLMITRSRALDRLRLTGGRSRREAAVERLDELSGSSDWATDRALIRQETGREVRRSFSTLPAAQRIALELAFYEGLTHLEIADVLGQPLGTVKTRIRLALDKMRRTLDGEPTAARSHEPSPFTVALAEHLARHPLRTAGYRRLPGLRLLVVDDDAETAALIVTVLQSAGATVASARSTSDGLARLDAEWPDVVLADISMPRDDGYSFIRQAQARADASGRRLLAAAFTALGEGERERALLAGFKALVSKPVQPARLLDLVGRLAGADAPSLAT